MAAIGFELRKFAKGRGLLSQFQLYGLAGLISSGPWVLSILGILLIGILSTEADIPSLEVARFQVSVTYLMALSLIVTGPLQLLLTRFIADRLYEEQEGTILPNLLGSIAVTTVVTGLLGCLLLSLFPDESLVYRLLMLSAFVTLSNIWIVAIILSATKEWQWILLSFLVSYSLTVGTSMGLRPFGLEGLLVGFLAGHGLLLFMLLGHVLRSYPGERLVVFEFIRYGKIYPSLAIIGFVYNLSIWADKLLFWFNPLTSDPVIGPLRVSAIYDIPIFLAYLSIVPGMAIFLVRMETDFAEKYTLFYRTIRAGGNLRKILQLKEDMVQALRQGIYEILKVQGMTMVVLIGMGDQLLTWFGIPDLYRILFNVDLVAVGIQVLLLATLNMLFYFDQRSVALRLSLLFAFCNIGFTLLTQYLGPAYYGYGFASAVLITSLVGLAVLSQKLEVLEYETFMLQKANL
jgi:uncharacterized membrane protein